MNADLKEIEKIQDIIKSLTDIIKENKTDIADNLHTSYAQYKIRENTNLEFATIYLTTIMDNIMLCYSE